MGNLQNKVVLNTMLDLLIHNLVFSKTVETFIKKYPYTDETQTTRIITEGKEVEAAILITTALINADKAINALIQEVINEFGLPISNEQLTIATKRWFDRLDKEAKMPTPTPPTPARKEKKREGRDVSDSSE